MEWEFKVRFKAQYVWRVLTDMKLYPGRTEVVTLTHHYRDGDKE